MKLKTMTIRVMKASEEVKNHLGKEFKLTGEKIRFHYEYDNGHAESTTYLVIKGKYTPYMSVRDCGDHYIKANYSSYDWIDKKTLLVIHDVEDK